jgi:hypothetical protein
MSGAISESARELAVQLARRLAQDSELAQRLCDAQQRLAHANDRLWWGLHPDGLAAVYGEHPAAIDVAFAENRSEVLGAPDPLAAAQQVHWSIHRAFTDYQTAAEERRALAADTGESIREFVDALVAAGRTEQQARNADVQQLAHASADAHPPGPAPRNPAVVTRSDAIPHPRTRPQSSAPTAPSSRPRGPAAPRLADETNRCLMCQDWWRCSPRAAGSPWWR